ncbi:Peptidase family M23 [anaerobic digester metagenome]|nr:peptidoglycan DD-metalloendopeptidase family protein [Lentimicrobiaceae bacterium]
MRKLSKKRIFIGIVAIILIALGLVVVDLQRSRLSTPPLSDEAYADEPRVEYGIVVDSFQVVKDVIKTGENLSYILSRYRIGPGDIDKLVQKSVGVFNLRNIKAGNKYTVLCTDDSLSRACYFIYEASPTSYVVFETGDSLHIHTGEKEVIVRQRAATGTISSSLWNAVIQAGASPNLAIELSEVYAWSIDFYAIQPGDKFSVLYEELVVDGQPIGTGNIITAKFTHSGRDLYAYRFIQDEKTDYFDEQGQSLRKAFLKAPLRYSRISSHFSNSRMHPVLRIRRPHHGVDYAAPKGTPVHSIGNGTVIDARWAGGAGRLVKIKHNATYTTAYMHLSGYGPGIKKGARVQQGQVIGYVGSSGLSTGPHLDFRFYKNGSPVDPLKVESPPALPVKKDLLDEYNALRIKLTHKLDSIDFPQRVTVRPDLLSEADF